MWWKQWKQQGFDSLLPYSHLKNDRRHANIEVYGTYRLCQVLRNKIPTSGQTRTVKVGYEEGHSLADRKEIVISVQRLMLLVPNNKVELLRTSTNYDFGLPEACCPRLPLDTDEQDDDAADMLPKGSLRLLETAVKVKDTECDSM